MADEPDYRTVQKLVLLQQCCCDSRCKASHHGVLSVILDACFDKPRCFIGPTGIGQIANLNPRTVRSSIRELEAWGYLTSEVRNNRSNWYMPNFKHAEQTGRLVERDKEAGSMRVHRPACKAPSKPSYAGLQVRPCGSTGPAMRVHRPEEAIDLNHSKKAVIAEPVLSDEEREQERLQEEEHQARLTAHARDIYAKAKQSCNAAVMGMIETSHGHRVEDLIDPSRKALRVIA